MPVSTDLWTTVDKIERDQERSNIQIENTCYTISGVIRRRGLHRASFRPGNNRDAGCWRQRSRALQPLIGFLSRSSPTHCPQEPKKRQESKKEAPGASPGPSRRKVAPGPGEGGIAGRPGGIAGVPPIAPGRHHKHTPIRPL